MGASVWRVDEQQKIGCCMEDPSRQQHPVIDKPKKKNWQPTKQLFVSVV